MNPYTNRVIIRNPEDFFNRKAEVKKIFSRIGGSRPQSISVVGERRIGKSSLLYYVCNESVRKEYLKDSKNYIFVFCDLQEKTDMNVDDFFTLISKKIAIEIREFSERKLFEKMTYDSFLELIQDQDEGGKKIILALDEFDVVMDNEKFGREFFSYLRALANSYNVAYITSSKKNLQEFSDTNKRTREIKASPFFNIFTHIPLGLFDEKSALKLIKIPSEREGIPLEDHAEFIFELAGFHPFFVQIACSNVFEYIELHESIDERGFETVKKDFFNEAECHFKYMWKDLKEEEQICLRTVAESKKLNREMDFYASRLAKRGFLMEDRGYRIFSESFREFITSKN